MKALAEDDGDLYLPNPEPAGPADYLVVCMEPSLGRWARSPEEARERVEKGFRNFLSSAEDFILHYAVENYLCSPGERYHLTDLSKGAMLVDRAGEERLARYERWFPLLQREIDLVGRPTAGIVAVGKVVERFLRPRLPSGRRMVGVIHYSGMAGGARNAAVKGHEEALDSFRGSVSMADLAENAERLLEASSMSEGARDRTLRRLGSAELSDSRQKLLFAYKLVFEGFRRARAE